MDISSHQNWLNAYVADRIRTSHRDPAPLQLKLEHTINVLANARAIAEDQAPAPELRRACLLAALYHDLSRFDQYLIYGTFKDRDSRNHGAWSVKLVKKEARLEEEEGRLKRLVRIAIGMHNRLSVPLSVQGEERLVCNVVRDADKLDILRVMDEHLAVRPYNPTVILGLPDDPALASPKVLEDALNGRSASYSDLKSVNDFRLLLGTWYYSMNFETSRQMFVTSGHARNVVAALPENSIYGRARNRLLSDLR